jgi:hypothetical protein
MIFFMTLFPSHHRFITQKTNLKPKLRNTIGFGLCLLLGAYGHANGEQNRCQQSLSDQIHLLAAPETNLSESLHPNLNRAVAELAALRVQIDQTKIQGKISPEQLALGSQFKLKHQALISFVTKNQLMTPEQLLLVLREAIGKHQLT